MIYMKKLTDDEIYFKYGHLRPSTYDIQSKCYKDRKINKNIFLKEEEDKLNKDLNFKRMKKTFIF